MRNEAETRAELIDPAITEAGWGKVYGTGGPCLPVLSFIEGPWPLFSEVL